MSSVLTTNIASVLASKNLSTAQSSMAQTVERLSSGLRINRARDDAAGLGISSYLTSQINGANQGVRNVNDAISMVQTAEGAISAASAMAQRMVSLATQGANETMSTSARDAIQAEMQELIKSINLIASRATFAGSALLDGTASSTKFTIQASNVAGDTIDLAGDAFLSLGATGSPTYSTYSTQFSTNTATVYSSTGSGSSLKYTAHTLETTNVDSTTNTYRLDGITTSITAGDYKIRTSGSGQAADLSEQIDNIDTANDTVSDVTTTFNNIVDEANKYIEALDKQRSLLGAYQNSLDYSSSNLVELSANLSAAKSRVVDTDYATETASLTKGQILQQAATAMLAQANQMPNVILSLLK